MFGFLKGLSVTFSQMTKKKLTLQYPEVRPVWPEHFRGIHEFIPELCIVCNQCARICPTNCISLSGSRDENKKLHIDTYDINFEICILCDLCTEVCPTESILMTDQFELATYSRDDLYKDMHWLYANHVNHGSYNKLQAQKAQAEKEAQEAAAQAAKEEQVTTQTATQESGSGNETADRSTKGTAADGSVATKEGGDA